MIAPVLWSLVRPDLDVQRRPGLKLSIVRLSKPKSMAHDFAQAIRKKIPTKKQANQTVSALSAAGTVAEGFA